MPFLSLSTNDTTIRAAEMDGSVIAYAQITNNLWKPTPGLNPQMDNPHQAGLANLFNATLVTNGSNYILTAPDGSVRSFTLRSYPIYGTNAFVLSRSRPYLDLWKDNRGNFYQFFYGSDANAPDYGQLRRIQWRNGRVLDFYYDSARHMVPA